MKATHKRLLEQVAQMAAEGEFGESIKSAQREYDQLPAGMAILLKTVLDFCAETSHHESEIAQIRSLAYQLLIVAYREAKRKDTAIALSFAHSFIEDYPGVPESSLLPQWCSLAQASLAFREMAHSENRLLVWQQSCKQFQAYNEFLNGLFGYLIVLLRTSLGRSVNIQVFDATYANKIRQFSSLTGGEDGPFYLFCRLARPRIRNAIAHETIWLDSDVGKVRFIEGRNPKIESEMELVEFMALSSIGSHLAHAYLAAIGVIAIMEEGTDFAKDLIPPQLVRVFTHVQDSAWHNNCVKGD